MDEKSVPRSLFIPKSYLNILALFRDRKIYRSVSEAIRTAIVELIEEFKQENEIMDQAEDDLDRLVYIWEMIDCQNQKMKKLK